MNTNPIIDALALLAQNPTEETVELRRNLRLVARDMRLGRPVPIPFPERFKCPTL